MPILTFGFIQWCFVLFTLLSRGGWGDLECSQNMSNLWQRCWWRSSNLNQTEQRIIVHVICNVFQVTRMIMNHSNEICTCYLYLVCTRQTHIFATLERNIDKYLLVRGYIVQTSYKQEERNRMDWLIVVHIWPSYYITATGFSYIFTVIQSNNDNNWSFLKVLLSVLIDNRNHILVLCYSYFWYC